MLRSLASFILVTTCVAAAEPGGKPAAKPATILDMLNFSQPLAASGWHFYAWSRSVDAIPASVTTDAQPAVRLMAVDAGAAGLSSRSYPVMPADTGWRITVRIQRSADYAGNKLWCFAAPADGNGAFLPPAVPMAPEVTPTTEWQSYVLTIPRSKVPEKTERMTFNLTTAMVAGATPAGSVLLDDVQVEVLH